MTERKPPKRSLESALAVLAWLHENSDDGKLRDEISRVRDLLWEMLER